jgi:CheY-like chemotaxis protein
MGEAKRKILLVDDSNTALMVERLLLGGTAYDIVTARDGREAVTLLEHELEASKAHARSLQEQNDALVHLAVASQLLGSASDRDRVLDVIEEIVVNMIGSEHLVVLEKLEPTDAELAVVRARGIGTDLSAQTKSPARRRRGARAHKRALDAEDHALLDLLCQHAAKALFFFPPRSDR